MHGCRRWAAATAGLGERYSLILGASAPCFFTTVTTSPGLTFQRNVTTGPEGLEVCKESPGVYALNV